LRPPPFCTLYTASEPIFSSAPRSDQCSPFSIMSYTALLEEYWLEARLLSRPNCFQFPPPPPLPSPPLLFFQTEQPFFPSSAKLTPSNQFGPFSYYSQTSPPLPTRWGESHLAHYSFYLQIPFPPRLNFVLEFPTISPSHEQGWDIVASPLHFYPCGHRLSQRLPPPLDLGVFAEKTSF